MKYSLSLSSPRTLHQRVCSHWRALLGSVLLLGSSAPLTSQAQTVPLGSAADYALLSGGAYASDSSSQVQAFGLAGIVGTSSGPLEASAGLLRAPVDTVALQTALSDLAAAQTYCAGLT